MKQNLMPENNSRHPIIEVTTIKLEGPYGALSPERRLLVEEIIETMKRVKRDRMHYAAQQAREAAKQQATTGKTAEQRKRARLRKRDRKLAQQKEA